MSYVSATAVDHGDVPRRRPVLSGSISVGLTSVGKIGLTLALPLVGSVAHAVTYLLLAAWALAGPRRALEALTLAWLATFLNPGIYELSEAVSVLRWVVTGCAGVSVAFTVGLRRVGLPRTLLWLFAFTSVAGAMAIAVSYAPDVSLFKLLSFLLGVGTILLGFHTADVGRRYWESWFLALFGTVVVVSLPFAFTDAGFFRNQRGFQGILNHPQAYGTFLGAMLIWVLLLRVERRGGGGVWPVLAVAFMSLVFTQSRTGMVATFGALLTVGLWSVLRRPLSLRFTWKRVLQLFSAGSLVVILGLAQGDAVRNAARDFVLKNQSEHQIQESFYLSRGLLILQSWKNFERHPFMGIGFGIASDPSELDIVREPVVGLPVGAAVEKGFLPTAILEEVGLLGLLLLALFLASWLKPVLRRGAPLASGALAAGALLVNVGESILFAVGGMGLLTWLLLGAARIFALEPDS